MEINTQLFQANVLTWYQQHGRKELPWQLSPTPYKVWVSEIMLQQTQVSTVIPYFERFLQHFPNIQALAEAPVDTVLHLWSGLGYYARARNLHRTAKIIAHDLNGIFPQTVIELEQLPGIGRSTAGAILALSQNIRAPILDGNVRRVLIRFFALHGNVADKKMLTILWQFADELTPEKNIKEYTQAMMDLGAMICTRTKPLCHTCPLQKDCQAFQQNLTHLLPEKKIKKVKPEKSVYMLLLQNEKQEILLEQRPNIGIWGGLWSLPEKDSPDELAEYVQQHFKAKLLHQKTLPTLKHIFTHFQLNIHPLLLSVKSTSKVAEKQILWYDGNQSIGLPKPVKSLLASIDI